MLKTQISGKYSDDDPGLFNSKIKLESLGINVRFPENSKIVAYKDGIALTFIPTSEKTFYIMELEFFEAIDNCDFHFVYNNYKSSKGYLGYSTCHEICYAIKKKKCILFQEKEILFSNKVPQVLCDIIKKNVGEFSFCQTDIFSEIDFTHLQQSVRVIPSYDLSIAEAKIVDEAISALFEMYK